MVGVFVIEGRICGLRLLRSKYHCRDSILPEIDITRQGSNLWRGICKIWDHVLKLLSWMLGMSILLVPS